MEAPATSNGSGDAPGTNGLTEEEMERQRMRPADVDADMREMARRKRVDAILSSKTFRSELDRLVEAGLIDGNSVGGCLQQISDMMGLARGGTGSGQAMQCVQPIADLRGAEASQFSKTEKMLRCKLASLCRVLDMKGWAHGVSNHITVRLSQDLEHFLVNPFGLLYGEVTASALLKADMQGNVVHAGSTGLGLGGGFARHAAVHAARPDVRCVLHARQPAVVAVSALRAGLLPLTEDAAALGPVATHQPRGDGDQELERLTRDLGVNSKVLLLQNAGALCCGETIEEAFFLLSRLVAACENQVRMLPLGVDNLLLLDEQEQQRAYEAARRPPPADADAEAPRHAWRLGELEFEALMRQMDHAGYRTGHVYRHTVRPEPPAHQSDVEYPPAASSYTFDTDDIFKYSPMRKAFAGARAGERTRWLNSPNVYQKVEVLETGTSDPKTITKWVADGAPAKSGTAIKVDAALQFVPKNTDPKEFKQVQKQIKENRRAGGISAGPQSHILEGVSWDEARQLQDAAESHAGDQVVLVGAASKGIIQRNYQHNAAVYKTPYAKNPFDQVTDEDLEEYKRLVDNRSRGQSAEPEAPQHPERVELTSDGEEVDVSHSSAPGDPPAAPAAPAAAPVVVPAAAAPVSAPAAAPAAAPEPTASEPAPEPAPVDPPARSPVHRPPQGEVTTNGEEVDAGHLSAVSHTDQEDISTSEASKKEKKKRKGLKTPSFLKKKKDKKKEKKEALEESK